MSPEGLAPNACPNCGEGRLIERVATALTKLVKREVYHCDVCSKDWCRDTPLVRVPTAGCATCGGRR
jgi:uncharacterized protein (DUF983 family)